MTSSGKWFLTLFLCLLALHLGLSMELPFVTWLGIGISLLGVIPAVQVERPTWGLLFVLFASGIFIGNQVLEDWAAEGSWPQDNGLGAGFLLSMFIYLLWLHVARPERSAAFLPALPLAPLQRDSQNILVLGLLMLLLISPPDAAVITVSGVPIAFITIVAMLVASLSLFAERCAHRLGRMTLLLAVVVTVPLIQIVLQAGQGPVIGALGDLIPRSSNFTPTGFSPNQQLRASVFLLPSTRAVMRVQADAPPGVYLAGNRLAVLDQDLTWQPVEQALQSLTALDADSLASGEYRFPIANHQAAADAPPAQSLTVHSLTSDNYLFVTPGASHVSGRFSGMTRNAADVWTPVFERGTNRRWQLDYSRSATPDTTHPAYLQLPDFWDQSLQNRSREFAGESTQTTVDNVLTYFLRRPYALQTNFDPEQPFHDFFLNEQPGYCFWFATATTLALRANGIPARLVGGYAIHEQLTSNLWLVRERDAHSWVEWQDQGGFWHTIDPTPPAIIGFFNGYQSSAISLWYHSLAGQWQILLDKILADALMANLIAWSGLGVLAFLFIREYRRIRGVREQRNNRSQQWQKLWRRFLSVTKLPENSAWTASNYVENLPTSWPESWQASARQFLLTYNHYRFANAEADGIAAAEVSLKQCAKTLARKP